MAENMNNQNYRGMMMNQPKNYGGANQRNTRPANGAEVINLLDVAEIIISNWLPIFIAGVIFAAAAFVGVKYFSIPTYISSSTLYINTERENVTDDVNTKTLIETQSLMPTYANILDSKTFLKSICVKMNNKYEYKQMDRMVTIQEIEETNLLTVSVETNDAHDSYMICKYIIESAPDEIYRVFEGGSVKVTDQPEESNEPIQRSALKTALLGFILGAILMAAFFFIRDMMDTRIKNPDELSARYGVPLLGEAPDFEADQKG